MRTRNKKYQKGFSLIELLIYMGLFSMMMTVITQIFVSSVSNKLETEATSSVDQDSSYIYHQLQHTIANATSITVPASYGIPGSTLTVSDGTDTYTYSLSSGNLIRTLNAQSDQLNGFNTRITNISFEKMRNGDGHDSVRINYTVQTKTVTNNGSESKTYQTTLGTR